MSGGAVWGIYAGDGGLRWTWPGVLNKIMFCKQIPPASTAAAADRVPYQMAFGGESL